MGALSGLGLLAVQLRTSWGATAALGVVAFLAAGVLSTAPRALATMHADQVAYETASASGLARDVISVVGAVPGMPSGMMLGPETFGGTPDEPNWAPFLANLDTVRAETPELLRSAMGAPDFHVTSTDPAFTEPVPASDLAEAKVFLRASPDLPEHGELVEGRWPAATAGPAYEEDEQGFVVGLDEPAPPFEVAVSRAVADAYGWELGGRYDTLSGTGLVSVAERYPTMVVLGIFETGDPDADYWLHHSLGARASVIADPNRGLLGTATAYVNPAMITPVTQGMAETRVWYPVDTAGVTAADVPVLLSQVNGQSAQTFPVDAGPGAVEPFQLRPDTRLSEILEHLLAQRTGVDAIVAVLEVGPLGATVAVLALGARLVVDRRRPALALLRARGASGAQLRLLMGGEGLVVGLGAAAAGFAAGLLLAAAIGVDAPVTAGQEPALALAAGLAPAAALALATSPAGLRATRADLAPRSRSRVRWVLEVLVVAGAALATWLLLSRGVVAGSGSGCRLRCRPARGRGAAARLPRGHAARGPRLPVAGPRGRAGARAAARPGAVPGRGAGHARPRRRPGPGGRARAGGGRRGDLGGPLLHGLGRRGPRGLAGDRRGPAHLRPDRGRARGGAARRPPAASQPSRRSARWATGCSRASGRPRASRCGRSTRPSWPWRSRTWRVPPRRWTV